MRASLVLTLGALLVAAATPAFAEPGAETLAGNVERALAAAFHGRLPATATVDAGLGARVVPISQALDIVRAADFARPAGARVTGSPSDVGYGVRTTGGPCYVAAVVTAFAFGDAPALAFDEPAVAIPAGVNPCGSGIATWIGDSGATPLPGIEADACVAFEGALGGWALVPDSCHVADFSRATIHGHVGRAHIVICEGSCFTIDQVMGGFWSSALPARSDAVEIQIS